MHKASFTFICLNALGEIRYLLRARWGTVTRNLCVEFPFELRPINKRA